MKYRKEPVVVVETVQYKVMNLPHVHTLNGPVFVKPGDWIITGTKGEKYHAKG